MDKPEDEKGIKSWPKSERPREILLEKGPEFVSDAGLLAILLRTGLKGKDAVSLARELISHFGGLRGVLYANKDDLEKIKGLGKAKIAQLLAAIEIAKRQMREEMIGKVVIKGPDDVLEYLKFSMGFLQEEVFKVIYLNGANEVLAIEDLFKGTINQSAIYPREVIKRALALNASALIFVHNHPSGDAKPSKDDLSINQKLMNACLAVELSPVDHLIISPSGHFSFKDNGLIK